MFNPMLAQILVPATGFRARDRVVVIAGSSIADGSFSPSAIALRINDSGFNDIEPRLNSLVDLDSMR